MHNITIIFIYDCWICQNVYLSMHTSQRAALCFAWRPCSCVLDTRVPSCPPCVQQATHSVKSTVHNLLGVHLSQCKILNSSSLTLNVTMYCPRFDSIHVHNKLQPFNHISSAVVFFISPFSLFYASYLMCCSLLNSSTLTSLSPVSSYYRAV